MTSVALSVSLAPSMAPSSVQSHLAEQRREFLEKHLNLMSPEEALAYIHTNPLAKEGSCIMFRRKDPTDSDPTYTISVANLLSDPPARVGARFDNYMYDPRTGIYREVPYSDNLREPLTWYSTAALQDYYKPRLIPESIVKKIEERYSEIHNPDWFIPNEMVHSSLGDLRFTPPRTFLIARNSKALEGYDLIYKGEEEKELHAVLFQITDQGSLLFHFTDRRLVYKRLEGVLEDMNFIISLPQLERLERWRSETNSPTALFSSKLPFRVSKNDAIQKPEVLRKVAQNLDFEPSQRSNVAIVPSARAFSSVKNHRLRHVGDKKETISEKTIATSSKRE